MLCQREQEEQAWPPGVKDLICYLLSSVKRAKIWGLQTFFKFIWTTSLFLKNLTRILWIQPCLWLRHECWIFAIDYSINVVFRPEVKIWTVLTQIHFDSWVKGMFAHSPIRPWPFKDFSGIPGPFFWDCSYNIEEVGKDSGIENQD